MNMPKIFLNDALCLVVTIIATILFYTVYLRKKNELKWWFLFYCFVLLQLVLTVLSYLVEDLIYISRVFDLLATIAITNAILNEKKKISHKNPEIPNISFHQILLLPLLEIFSLFNVFVVIALVLFNSINLIKIIKVKSSAVYWFYLIFMSQKILGLLTYLLEVVAGFYLSDLASTSTIIFDTMLLGAALITRLEFTIEETYIKLEEKNQQLMRIQRLESIGSLVGGIAHDFNNLLQAMLGSVEVLQLSPNLKSDDLELVSNIKNAGDRGAKVINQLLLFVRKQNSSFRALNLNQEIKMIEKLIQSSIPKIISLTLDLEPNISSINGDAGQLQQLILNLTNNSRDAMPDGGNIFIKTRQIIIDTLFCELNNEFLPGDYVTLNIQDTGLGMSDEVKRHLFEPFFTTKEIGKGTGLGLAMVFRIVQNHHGHIKCYSELGKGTQFLIYLPVSKEVIGESPKTIDLSTLPHGTERILIVDDEDTIRKYSRRILSQYGYKVFEADTGITALESLDKINKGEKENIDLIILDLLMPKMDGKKFLETYKESMNPNMKVVLASGFTNYDPNDEIQDSRVKGILAKPFNSVELLTMIRHILDDKGQTTQQIK